MRLVSFQIRGVPRYGAVEGNGVVDLCQRLGSEFPTLREFIAGNARSRAETFLERGRADYALEELTFLPVIPEPAKVICVGVNYHDHRLESGRPEIAHPTLFVRWPSSLVGHNQPICRPRESERFDFEGEIAIVIGKAGRRISRDRALDHIAGFSCFQDGSVRDFQQHSSQFTAGKNFQHSGAFGPCLVTRDEIADPRAIAIKTRLNGIEMQSASSADLIFGFEALINYCSTLTELLPGDVIATGTPGGVGAARNPPVFMRPGDTVEVEVSGVGLLRNPVAEG